jgi:regulator of cell morphogenesis and NO signaling
MNITENTTVADIAAALPSSVRVFQRHGIDFCCGGKTPLSAACQDRGIAFPAIVSAIEASATTPSKDERDWTREPLRALIDHIVVTYHNALREELPRLESMAGKVARVHAVKAPYLLKLEAIVSELSADLRAHMRKEEFVLFPAIQMVEAGEPHPAVPISAPITVMEHEHDQAGALLSELRAMTNDYTTPPWACQTFRALYQGLSELESAMHVHVHLENNVLFPRALALSDAARRVG